MIISRREAIKQGLTRYFTGTPCKKGHVSERAVLNWACIECQQLWQASDKGKSSKHLSDKKYRQENHEKKSYVIDSIDGTIKSRLGDIG